MRLVRVTAPEGKGPEIAKIAFKCGISEVSIHQVEQHKPGSTPAVKEAVDMHVATPAGRSVIEAVVRAPFYDREEYSIDIREPRSILTSRSVREITLPVAPPMMDIDQELWQFSHITYSFVVRVFIASVLLAYGMIHDNPLLMIGGLIFLPFTPLVLGFAYGVLARESRLMVQGIAAFLLGTLLIVSGGVAVASMAEPPMMFDKFPPISAGALFSLAVGIAAALATADDAGHRQLVGLAAASQIALIPAWFGISLVFGFTESPAEKLGAFGVNTACLVLGAAVVYGALLWRARSEPSATRG